jgi:hypothetical protein
VLEIVHFMLGIVDGCRACAVPARTGVVR